MLASDDMLTEQLFAHRIHRSLKTDCDINKIIRETNLKKPFQAGEDNINNRTFCDIYVSTIIINQLLVL